MAPEGMKCRNPAGNEGLLIEIGMSSTAFKSTSVFRAPGLILFATHWLWPRRGAGRPAGPQRRSQSVYGVHVLPLLPLLKRLWVIGRPRLPITERTRDIFDSPPHQWLSGRIRLTPLAPRTIRHPAVWMGLTVAVSWYVRRMQSPSPVPLASGRFPTRARFPDATSRPIQFSSSRFQSSPRPKICIQVSSDICDMRC